MLVFVCLSAKAKKLPPPPPVRHRHKIILAPTPAPFLLGGTEARAAQPNQYGKSRISLLLRPHAPLMASLL